jgi:hypothetical protein
MKKTFPRDESRTSRSAASINSTPFRMTFLVAALACAAVSVQTSASAQPAYYPQCTAPYSGNCSMPVNSGAAGMLRPVNIYPIWYGNWTFDGIDLAIQQLVPTLIQGLNDSAISSILQTYNSNYGHPNGQIVLKMETWDGPGLHGNFMGDVEAQNEISQLITAGQVPNDIDGVYVLLPHSDVTVVDNTGAKYCQGNCGYNYSAIINDTRKLKYVVVPEASSACSTCRYNFLTPNIAGGLDLNGQIDLQLSVLVHELAEVITDPDGTNGWFDNNNPPNTQMADFCGKVPNGSYAIGAWYNVQSAGCPFWSCPAKANAFLNGTDFLIPLLRVNGDNGQTGYCANSYGGPFWGQNFGYSWSPAWPTDWSPNNYKGECQNGQPLIGLSKYTSWPNHAHDVFCDTNADWSHGRALSDFNLFQQSDQCHTSPFDGLYGFTNNYNVNGNWDPGYYVDQCNQNEFAAGVSQSVSGRTNGLLCCPGTGSSGVSANGCVREILGQSPIPTADWDYGFSKAQCQNRLQYVAGVSADPSTGAPHAILCCNP